MMLQEFIRYYLVLLGISKQVQKLIRGGQERPIASLEQLLDRFPDLAGLPEFQEALADP